MAAHGDLTDVTRFVERLWRPGDVREVRILKVGRYRRTHSGYFDDPALIEPAIAAYDGTVNVYVTVNPVDPALLARAKNRIVEGADTTTSDADILARRWIPIDIDPRRVAVEHNLVVLKRTAFETTEVRDGDQVEIVNFVGGGSDT